MIIYLDIDGVLRDFVTEACYRHRRPNPYVLEYRGTMMSKRLWDYWDMSEQEFWRVLGINFWMTGDLYPEARQLIDNLRKVYDDIYLCTNTPYKGIPSRLLWVKTNLPEFIDKTIILEKKYLLAKPDAMLVDDFDSQVEAFRAHGGKALLMPRPWNKAHNKEDSETWKNLWNV